MTKEEMELQIPKNTNYCYTTTENETIVCPWYKFIGIKKYDKTNCEFANTCKEECWSHPLTSCKDRIVRCEYLDYTDEKEDTLLWNRCKECGVNECDPED